MRSAFVILTTLAAVALSVGAAREHDNEEIASFGQLQAHSDHEIRRTTDSYWQDRERFSRADGDPGEGVQRAPDHPRGWGSHKALENAYRGDPPRTESNEQPAPDPVIRHQHSIWDRLAECESGGNWAINTGNGYYGGIQFSLRSWQWVGGSGYPHESSREEQIYRGTLLLERQGWRAWPACSKKLGLRR